MLGNTNQWASCNTLAESLIWVEYDGHSQSPFKETYWPYKVDRQIWPQFGSCDHTMTLCIMGLFCSKLQVALALSTNTCKTSIMEPNMSSLSYFVADIY